MRRRWLFLFVCAGCVQSALNPTDAVSLEGRALKEDKSPLASAELDLKRSENSACLGLLTLTTSFAKVRTEADGSFRHQLTGADTQNGDIARCFQLELPRTDRGAYAFAEFLVQVETVKLPELQLWHGEPRATDRGGLVDIAFKDISATHPLTGLKPHLYVTSGIDTLWRTEVASSPASVSEYVLEDFPAPSAQLWTMTEKKGSGTTFTVRYASERLDLPQKQKVPVSRGASCAYNQAPTPCPLTDGKAVNVLLADSPEITLSLGAPKTIRKVVLRGYRATLPASVVLEGSPGGPGATFTKLADVAGSEYQELDVPTGTPAVKEIRLRGSRSDGGTFTFIELDEVSLFE